MTQRAMPISISARAMLVGLALVLSAPVAAQMRDEPDVEDVARTPLEDFNIDSKDIPEALLAAVRDPYASQGLDSCNAIVAEIAALDQVLGADFDIADEESRGISDGRIA